jgi:hypothetical protein
MTEPTGDEKYCRQSSGAKFIRKKENLTRNYLVSKSLKYPSNPNRKKVKKF